MKSPDSHSSREDQREDPSQMWGGESWPAFKGKVAEAKQPKSYRMEIASGFRGNGTAIDVEKWKQWFYEKDKGTNKDETYYHKMLAAIEAWNNIPANEREEFLATGDYTEDANEEIFTLLTSSRIIDLVDPAPDPGRGGRGGHGGGGGGGGEIPPGGYTGGGHGGGERPTNDDNGENDPGNNTPENNDDKPGDDGPGEDEPGDDKPGEDEPGDDKPGEDEPEDNPEDGPEGDEPEDDPEDDDGDKKRRRGKFFGWIFGRRKKDKRTPKAQPSGGGEEPTPEDPTPEDPDITEVIDKIGENPEQIEKYKVLLVTKLEELPAEEKKEVIEKVSETAKKLVEAGKKGLAALLFLLLLLNPIEGFHDTGRVTGTRQETQQVMVEPGHTVQERTPGAPIIESMTTTETEIVPVEDVEFGSIVTLEPGTELHYTSDRRAPSFERHYTVKEGDELIINRLAIYDQNGNLVGTRHMSNGDAGKISELIQEIAPEGEYTLFLHYAHPSGEGIDQHQDLGWSDAATVKVEVTRTTTYEIPGEDVVTERYVPPVYEEQTTEMSFSGEVADSKAGSIEITNADGSKAVINIRNADGSLVQPGDVVMGDDGCSYQIESATDSESGTRVNVLKLAHDIAVVGTGITAFFMLRRRKKTGEEAAEGGETETEGGNSEGESAETTTEGSGEFIETPVYINLTAEELKNAMGRFTELAGDQADAIAERFSSEAGMTPERIAELSGEPAEDSIYATMTPAERAVAATLLTHLHEPSSISRLSQLLGVENYQDFIHSIGIDESAIEVSDDDDEEDDGVEGEEEEPSENTNPEGEEA